MCIEEEDGDNETIKKKTRYFRSCFIEKREEARTRLGREKCTCISCRVGTRSPLLMCSFFLSRNKKKKKVYNDGALYRVQRHSNGGRFYMYSYTESAAAVLHIIDADETNTHSTVQLVALGVTRTPMSMTISQFFFFLFVFVSSLLT